MIETVIKVPVSKELVSNYFRLLVNSFFKILPIREAGEKTLPIYIQSLQVELLGCKELISELNNNPHVLELASILQYLHDNPDCSVAQVKREVFKAITICNKIVDFYERGEL